MPYEAPELNPLPPATEAIRGGTRKESGTLLEGLTSNELSAAYADWE